MNGDHPRHEMDLPISLEMYQQLASASLKTGCRHEIWEIGAAAIREWLARNDPESFGMPAVNGYQWKSVFLPNGTVLRTVFGGKNYHCRVEGDAIVYNNDRVSPAGFVNAAGGVRRNAWKALWILFPNSSVWRSAGSLRPKKKAKRRQS
jgi:hypothetical protein